MLGGCSERGLIRLLRAGNYLHAWSLIECLLSGSRPSTIVWFVIAVYVDAVDAHLRMWPTTHISEKAFKTRLLLISVYPPITDGNASASVVSVSGRAGSPAAG